MIVMAQKTVVVLVDDLDGEPADTTVRFGFDSHEYELDLTEANAQALREAFARYIPAARKTSGGRRASASAEKPAKAFQGFDPAAVRAWAAGNGYTVSPRGRIRAEVLEAFRAAGN
jgi:Lsr2